MVPLCCASSTTQNNGFRRTTTHPPPTLQYTARQIKVLSFLFIAMISVLLLLVLLLSVTFVLTSKRTVQTNLALACSGKIFWKQFYQGAKTQSIAAQLMLFKAIMPEIIPNIPNPMQLRMNARPTLTTPQCSKLTSLELLD
eukprot:6459145-Amphidinium_carterae.2